MNAVDLAETLDSGKRRNFTANLAVMSFLGNSLDAGSETSPRD